MEESFDPLSSCIVEQVGCSSWRRDRAWLGQVDQTLALDQVDQTGAFAVEDSMCLVEFEEVFVD